MAYIQRCDFSESEHGILIDEAKPIKLTETWLRKLGFEGNNMDMWIVLPTGNELELHIDCVREGEFKHPCLTQGRSDKGDPGKDYKFAYLNDVEYVHELQNLFFALTGTELYNGNDFYISIIRNSLDEIKRKVHSKPNKTVVK